MDTRIKWSLNPIRAAWSNLSPYVFKFFSSACSQFCPCLASTDTFEFVKSISCTITIWSGRLKEFTRAIDGAARGSLRYYYSLISSLRSDAVLNLRRVRGIPRWTGFVRTASSFDLFSDSTTRSTSHQRCIASNEASRLTM